jgi:hypothetical protein
MLDCVVTLQASLSTGVSGLRYEKFQDGENCGGQFLLGQKLSFVWGFHLLYGERRAFTLTTLR